MRINPGNPALTGPFAALSPVSQPVAPSPVARYAEEPAPVQTGALPASRAASGGGILGGLFGAQGAAPGGDPSQQSGGLGGLFDFSDPRVAIGWQLLANGSRQPNEMLSGVPQVAMMAQKAQKDQREEAQAVQQKNKTIEWLQTNRPDLVPMAEAGMIGEAFKIAMQKPETNDYQQRAAAAEQYGLGVGSQEYRNFILTGDLPEDTTPDSIRALELRADAAGLQRGSPEYQKFMATGGDKGPLVTVNNGESDKFYENLDKKNAETFASLSDTGIRARARMGQLNRLESLLAQGPSGAEAATKQWLGDMGIPTEGLDSLQATRALIEKMVPEQRAPGTGPMSDADIQMFRNSLPRVINQPGGNELIIQTARGIAEYEAQMGEIADAVADRRMTPAEAREAMRSMENPLDAYREVAGGGAGKASTGVQWKVVE